MTDLISVADGAFPHPPYDFLPPTVAAWAGYVGGHTEHYWTPGEVAGLETTGREWWAIWTAIQYQAITRTDAHADAMGMIAGLQRLAYSKARPVFYDIEESTWVANPLQTEDAARYWCQLLASAGWVKAYWYGPRDSTAGWRADWTGVPPAVLPADVVGVQYDHALSDDRYDISRFDASLLEVDPMPTAQEIAAAIMSYPTTPSDPGGLHIAYGTRIAETDRHVGEIDGKLDKVIAQQAELIALLTPPAPTPPTP